MADPYKVLGLRPGASEQDVARAYRRLAKKYHPDLNPGNPAAEARMRDINEAYARLKNNGGYGSGETADTSSTPPHAGRTPGGDPFGEGPGPGADPFAGFSSRFGGFGRGGWQGSPFAGMHEVRAAVQARRYSYALQLLAAMQTQDAEWFYCSAVAHAGLGNRVTALAHAQEAVRMDPDNEEYAAFLQRYQQGVFHYRAAAQGFGFAPRRLGGTLLGILVAQLLCVICCRPC